MSPATDPFRPDAGLLLAEGHGQVFTATATIPGAADVPLDVTGWGIGWDERRAPRVLADLTCNVPDEATIVNALDPRTGARVKISAGYVWPGGQRDVAQVANLGFRRRAITRPGPGQAPVMELALASDEALVIDASPILGGTVSTSSTPAAMVALLNAALAPDPTVTITHPDATAVSLTDIADRWATIDDLSDTIEADVFDGGMRDWHIDRRPTVAGIPAAHLLRTGPGGTVTKSESVLTRDDWANMVVIRYRWRDASNVDHVVVGSAYVASGPFGYTLAGEKRLPIIEREVPTTQTAANKAAAAVLARMLARSASLTVTAVTAWWLRPGMTVTVQLPTGDQARHLVASVDFASDWTMRVVTRLPDKASTIGA